MNDEFYEQEFTLKEWIFSVLLIIGTVSASVAAFIYSL
jgi:hypothetical protein